MSSASGDDSSSRPPRPLIVFGVLSLVLALRLLHLSAAVQSPLTYQPGPDEDYYFRFAEAVRHGSDSSSGEFTFMDPAYGYLLGAIFHITGANPFVIYLLQCLLDTGTAFGILTIGRLLGRPRAGLYGALLYAVTSVAIMFDATLLKEVWVAAFMTWWVAGALALLRSQRAWGWLALGAYCGIGIAFRSTLLLVAGASLLLPLFRELLAPHALASRAAGRAALLACGIAAALLPWSLRNHHAYGGFSPLPHNGGIVLHQLYNEANWNGGIWIPDFVGYSHPSEIWRGYAAEASRREGRPLTPLEVDRYWRSRAVEFMAQHPGHVLGAVGARSVKFLSATEVPINRSLAEERMFSVLLEWLPAPAPWLLAMGLAGLGWLAFKDRRWPLVALPIAVAWLTVALFFAEDRFRFHALAILALCSGVWIDAMVGSLRARRARRAAILGAVAAGLGLASAALGREYPPPPIRWDHIVWGYIKMGRMTQARALAERIAAEQPQNEPVLEALGFAEARAKDYPDAVRDYRRAIALRPQSHIAHYNLAKAYLEMKEPALALPEARTAAELHPGEDTRDLLRQAEEANR